jgi:hypothetical protein
VRLVNVSFCTRCAEAVSCCSCHLPLLYIGLECGLTNNVKLADKFFLQSQSIAPQDPFVMHEMGVICFQNHEWVCLAFRYFDHFEVSAVNRFTKTRWSWSTGVVITALVKDLSAWRETCHVVHWKSYVNYPRIEPGPLEWKLAANCLSSGTVWYTCSYCVINLVPVVTVS